MKICIKCSENKSLDLFVKAVDCIDGRSGVCKKCKTEQVTRYYLDNPEKKLEKKKKDRISKTNWKSHHISEEKYNEMLSLYEGKCYICKNKNATDIDHNHNCCNGAKSCGKCIRGILCNNCNTALGVLEKNRQNLNFMLQYIDEHIGV